VGSGSKMDIGMQFHWEDDAFLDTLDTSQLLAAQMHIEQALARKNTGVALSPSETEGLDHSPRSINGTPEVVVSPGETVRVYVDGCFDLMHSGHYNALRQAKLLFKNCVLVAGVHSDAEITAAKGMPVFNNEERLDLVRACKWVDEVEFDTPYNPTIELLDRLECQYVAHGDDITATYKEVQDAGRLKIIKRTEGVSTTDIVGRLLLMTREHHSQSASDQFEVGSENTTSQFHRSSSMQNFSAYKDSNFLPTTRRITQFANGDPPKRGAKIVYIDGSFDLFHPGHVAALKAAKELGDFLYVGIHNDQVVNDKLGSNYPICTLHERALCVLACKYVDEVVFGAPWEVTKELITLLNVSYVVEVADLKFSQESGEQENAEQSAHCYHVPRELGIHTTLAEPEEEVLVGDESRQLGQAEVVSRIVNNRLDYLKKFEKKSAAEDEYNEGREHVEEL